MDGRMERQRALGLWVMIALLALAPAAFAQQQTSQSSQQQQGSAGAPGESSSKDPAAPASTGPPGPAPTNEPLNLETGQSISNFPSPLRWGRVSVLSFDAVYSYDSDSYLPSGTPNGIHSAALRGNIMYKIDNRKMNLTLQYRPFFYLAEGGQKQSNYASQWLNFNTSYRLSPRWNLALVDSFYIDPDRGRLADPAYLANAVQGGSFKRPFLASGGTSLGNSLNAGFSYAKSARDTITISLRQDFNRVSEEVAYPPAANPLPGDPPAPPLLYSNVHQFVGAGTGLAWTRSFSPDLSLSVSYDFDTRFYLTAGTSNYQSVALSFYKRFGRGRTWLVRAGGGPAWMHTEQPAQLGPSYRSRTYRANAELFKMFRTSSLAISYDRSQTFAGVISDNFNDRYYANYSQRLGRYISTNFGAGFIRQSYSGTTTTIDGLTGWGRVDFRLGRGWSFFGSYSYFDQQGFFSTYFNNRHTVLVGFRWSWNPEGN
jgi:hypothetical protein